MSTRILSAFNLLKRVGFAVLLFFDSSAMELYKESLSNCKGFKLKANANMSLLLFLIMLLLIGGCAQPTNLDPEGDRMESGWWTESEPSFATNDGTILLRVRWQDQSQDRSGFETNIYLRSVNEARGTAFQNYSVQLPTLDNAESGMAEVYYSIPEGATGSYYVETDNPNIGGNSFLQPSLLDQSGGGYSIEDRRLGLLVIYEAAPTELPGQDRGDIVAQLPTLDFSFGQNEQIPLAVFAPSQNAGESDQDHRAFVFLSSATAPTSDADIQARSNTILIDNTSPWRGYIFNAILSPSQNLSGVYYPGVGYFPDRSYSQPILTMRTDIPVSVSSYSPVRDAFAVDWYENYDVNDLRIYDQIANLNTDYRGTAREVDEAMNQINASLNVQYYGINPNGLSDQQQHFTLQLPANTTELAIHNTFWNWINGTVGIDYVCQQKTVVLVVANSTYQIGTYSIGNALAFTQGIYSTCPDGEVFVVMMVDRSRNVIEDNTHRWVVNPASIESNESLRFQVSIAGSFTHEMGHAVDFWRHRLNDYSDDDFNASHSANDLECVMYPFYPQIHNGTEYYYFGFNGNPHFCDNHATLLRN